METKKIQIGKQKWIVKKSRPNLFLFLKGTQRKIYYRLIGTTEEPDLRRCDKHGCDVVNLFGDIPPNLRAQAAATVVDRFGIKL